MKLIIRIGSEAILVPENAISDGDLANIQALEFNQYSAETDYWLAPKTKVHFELVKDVLPAEEEKPCDSAEAAVTNVEN